MMKIFKLILLVNFTLSFHVNSNAEKIYFNNFKPKILFTYLDGYYVIDKDSLFYTKDKIHWTKSAHGLDIESFTAFDFIESGNQGYFYHTSGGVFYKFDGKNFIKNNSKYGLRSHYSSTPVVHKKVLYLCSGYGLFEYRNDIIYYDTIKNEWEKLVPITPSNKIFERRFRALGQSNDEYLYIGGGSGIYQDKPESYTNEKVMNDLWRFSFKEKTWQKLGEISAEIQYKIPFTTIKFKNGNLLIQWDQSRKQYKIYYVDFEKNIIISYLDPNVFYFTDMKLEVNPEIKFNANTHTFVVLIDNENGYSTPVFLWEEELLGVKTNISKAYSQNNDYIIIILALLVIALLILLIVVRKRSSKTNEEEVFEQIANKTEEFRNELSEEEFKILEVIIENHPQAVQFPDLLKTFNNTYGYESQIKKLRSSLHNINNAGINILKIEVDFIIQQKNQIDKRIKEIRINQQMKPNK